MSRKINTLFGAAALVAGTAFVTTSVTGQDGGMDGMPEMSPEQAAMMDAWMAYMTPGEEHAEMMRYAGSWTMHTKMWMDPAAPPEEADHLVTVEPIMGGRYLLEHVRGEITGMPFTGMNISGYDNHTKTYTFAWVDNFGTGIFTGQGSANADGSVITYMTEKPDFLNPGAMVKSKSVVRHMGLDKMVFEMHDLNESGEWWKSFEGVYTRNTDGAAKMNKTGDSMKSGR